MQACKGRRRGRPNQMAGVAQTYLVSSNDAPACQACGDVVYELGEGVRGLEGFRGGCDKNLVSAPQELGHQLPWEKLRLLLLVPLHDDLVAYEVPCHVDNWCVRQVLRFLDDVLRGWLSCGGAPVGVGMVWVLAVADGTASDATGLGRPRAGINASTDRTFLPIPRFGGATRLATIERATALINIVDELLIV